MVPGEVLIPLKISGFEKISFKVSGGEKIGLKVSDSGGGIMPVYDGETIVTPKTVQQELNTANTTVLSDITVLKIPYFETTNEKGTTVIIGGNG